MSFRDINGEWRDVSITLTRQLPTLQVKPIVFTSDWRPIVVQSRPRKYVSCRIYAQSQRVSRKRIREGEYAIQSRCRMGVRCKMMCYQFLLCRVVEAELCPMTKIPHLAKTSICPMICRVDVLEEIERLVGV